MNGVPKTVWISKKYSGSLCRIPYPTNSKSSGIPEFRKSKLTKFWKYSWNSSQAGRAVTTGFPMSSMGVMWILQVDLEFNNFNNQQN